MVGISLTTTIYIAPDTGFALVNIRGCWIIGYYAYMNYIDLRRSYELIVFFIWRISRQITCTIDVCNIEWTTRVLIVKYVDCYFPGNITVDITATKGIGDRTSVKV